MCEIEIEIERERERDGVSYTRTSVQGSKPATRVCACVCVCVVMDWKEKIRRLWLIYRNPRFWGFSHWNRNGFLGAHDGAWLWLWLLAKSSNPVECGLWVFSAALFFVVLLCLVGVGRSLWL